jgi:hypothetical protein
MGKAAVVVLRSAMVIPAGTSRPPPGSAGCWDAAVSSPEGQNRGKILRQRLDAGMVGQASHDLHRHRTRHKGWVAVAYCLAPRFFWRRLSLLILRVQISSEMSIECPIGHESEDTKAQ